MAVTLNIRTTTRTITGESNVNSLCHKLTSSSQWFSVLPLPDDQWEVTVKEENGQHLQAWVRDIEQKAQDQP